MPAPAGPARPDRVATAAAPHSIRRAGSDHATPRRRAWALPSPCWSKWRSHVVWTPAAEYLPEGEEPKGVCRHESRPGLQHAAMERWRRDVEAYLLPRMLLAPILTYRRGDSRSAGHHAYISLRITPDSLGHPVSRCAQRNRAAWTLSPASTSSFPACAPLPRGSIISSNDGGTCSINLDIAGPLTLPSSTRWRRPPIAAPAKLFGPASREPAAVLSLAQPMAGDTAALGKCRRAGMTAKRRPGVHGVGADR